MKKYLDKSSAKEIVDAINEKINLIAKQINENAPFNKTKYGRVISSTGGVFTVEIEKVKYPKVLAVRNVGEIKVGDSVIVSVPNNNMSNAVILGVADGSLFNYTKGTVTEVGVTAGSGIFVEGSPITESGDIIITNTGVLSAIGLSGDISTQQFIDAILTGLVGAGDKIVAYDFNLYAESKYMKFSSGLLIQWGTKLTNFVFPTTLNYPYPFSSFASYSIVLSALNFYGDLYVSGKNTGASVDINCSGSGPGYTEWIAIGF